MSVLLGSALGVAGSAVAMRLWYRRFDVWRTAEDETFSARTSDGWNLGLTRYRPRTRAHRYPVLCSHGMAGSRLIYDLHPDTSLARYLAASGFDTWLLDLRGRQQSWPDSGDRPELQWCFDDFVDRDLPAAVERVCDATGAGRDNGFSIDYGHDDLLAGTTSPREIFPIVRSFLEEQCHTT